MPALLTQSRSRLRWKIQASLTSQYKQGVKNMSRTPSSWTSPPKYLQA
jgi:hypothetical protein